MTKSEMVAADVRRRKVVPFGREIRLLTRLCENSEMAFWKNEKGVLGPLAAKENAPYRNCGGRFFRVAGWRGVFAQSGQSALTSFPPNLRRLTSAATATEQYPVYPH